MPGRVKLAWMQTSADDFPPRAVLEGIRQLRAEGKGAKAITAALNAERVPCRGQRWHLTTVRRLLARQESEATND